MSEQGVVVVVLLLALAVLLTVTAGKVVRIVPQAHAGLVERLGRYLRTIPPGVNLVAPFVDQVRLVDTRSKDLDIPPTQCRTADGATVTVEARLRYRVTDPVKAVYEVANHREALAQVTASTLRSLVVPGKTVYEAQASHHELAWDLRTQVVSDARAWGVEVEDAEIRGMRQSAAP